jgi:hypothetical protein
MTTMTSALAGLGKLEKFFGCPTAKIDAANLIIALNYDFPSWLKGKPRELNLPRNSSERSYRHCFSLGTQTVPASKRADIIVWLMENTRGYWHLGTITVWLYDDTDAVKYKLTFS